MDDFLRRLRRVLFGILNQKDALIFPIALVALIAGVATAIPALLESKDSVKEKETLYGFKTAVLLILPVMLAMTAFMVRFLSGSTERFLDSDDRDEIRLMRHEMNRLMHAKGVLDGRANFFL